jgi:hypothetical protein
MRSTAAALLLRASRRALIALSSCAFAQASAAPQDDLRALVESGRSAEAYPMHCAALAALDASQYPPEFDLWCGIAAVDIGRAAEGVLSLERYVLQFPDDIRAHLELARAYFHAGDDIRSRQEFEAVAKLDLPAEVRAGIDRYSMRCPRARHATGRARSAMSSSVLATTTMPTPASRRPISRCRCSVE